MDSLFEERSRTPLEACGEFGLTELLTKEIKLKNKSSVYGVGDDAAIIDAQNRLQVVSKDLLIEGVHFDLTYAPLKHVGYKAIASNLSDIAAIREWVQQLVDYRIREMLEEDDETISVEELRAILHKTIHEEYAKP